MIFRFHQSASGFIECEVFSFLTTTEKEEKNKAKK